MNCKNRFGHYFFKSTFNPFWPNVPFIYPMKTFSGCIRIGHWAKIGKVIPSQSCLSKGDSCVTYRLFVLRKSFQHLTSIITKIILGLKRIENYNNIIQGISRIIRMHYYIQSKEFILFVLLLLLLLFFHFLASFLKLQMFYKIGGLKNFVKFTGKDLD